MSGLSLIYHEKQQEALCAVHCINNLLQGDYTNAGDLAQIAQQLDDQEDKMLSENGKQSIDYQNYLKRGKTNVSVSGDFSIQVVTEYLKIFGIELKWLFDGEESKKIIENPK
jgi:Ataxin-3